MLFDDHKISVDKVLRIIPDGLLSKLAFKTNVDYYAKVLQGERLFHLLLYALLKTDRLSQRFLEDVFKSKLFKRLFNYVITLKVCHSSVSSRLSTINLDFFREAHACIYDQYQAMFSEEEQLALRVIRVDSTMIAETSTRLKKGMTVGKNKTRGMKKQQVKCSMAYDGNAACTAVLYTDSTYLSEDNALNPLVTDMIKSEKHHANVYVFDRGMNALHSLEEIVRLEQEAYFVCRVKTNRKVEVVKDLTWEQKDCDMEKLWLVSDQQVHLYDNKNGRFSPTLYRLVICERKQKLDTTPRRNKGKQKKVENRLYFLTNNFEMTPGEVTDCYKKRWDIEVFFRFLKQDLNFKHFLSVNENGLQVVLYMTLIAAMLLMIYKKVNGIGFTTAKRRFMMEMEEKLMVMVVQLTGGDPDKLDKLERYVPK